MKAKLRGYFLWSLLASASLLLFAENTSQSVAATIAFTSFENETPDAQYTDTGDPAMDHDLLNNSGQSPVDSTASSTAAGDLGFDARYENTRNADGLTDGDVVGVTDFVNEVGAFTDGTQGYELSDADGRMVVEFDAVAIDPISPSLFSVDFFVQDTGWEANDEIHVFLSIDGSTTVDIINTAGSDIDDLGIEDSWIRASADVTGLGSSAVLTVALDSNAADEALFMDRVIFTDDPSLVPEPGSLLLALFSLCVSGLIFLRFRWG